MLLCWPSAGAAERNAPPPAGIIAARQIIRRLPRAREARAARPGGRAGRQFAAADKQAIFCRVAFSIRQGWACLEEEGGRRKKKKDDARRRESVRRASRSSLRWRVALLAANSDTCRRCCGG